MAQRNGVKVVMDEYFPSGADFVADSPRAPEKPDLWVSVGYPNEATR
jgi:hypothetical protein